METKMSSMLNMNGKEAARNCESKSHTSVSYNETGTRTTSSSYVGRPNRCLIATIVYIALLLDNVLLTVIVPILPDYLASLNDKEFGSDSSITEPQKLSMASSERLLPPQPLLISSKQAKQPMPAKSFINFTLINFPIEHKITELKPLPRSVAESVGETGKSYNRILHSNRLNYRLINDTIRKNSNDLNVMSTKDILSSENGSIGFLLAVKAFVQLLFNPIVGNVSSKYGYRIPIVVGTFFLLLSSLIFAIGETYITLLLARGIQGIASACISICGMSLVAQYYLEKERRSKVMGIILGSIALGVLIGYPFGSILYDLVGKSAPFLILSTIIFLNLGFQLLTLDISVKTERTNSSEYRASLSKWQDLLADKIIVALVLAIWFSTSTMAILEPCLPIWLMQHLKPSKWQLGTVFIPDSLGYFVGTNFFGSIAFKVGQVKIACLSLLLVGISSILIPSAQTVSQLLLPHFFLGLGIGIIDAALVPLLATIVDCTLSADYDDKCDENSVSTYGTIYAIQQTSVSLAYCLAPLFGGLLAGAVGFIWLMRIIGFINIIYGPILVFIYQRHEPRVFCENSNELLHLSGSQKKSSQYKQLYNSVDNE